MIPIKKLPDLDWSDLAAKEIALTGEALLRESDIAYRIGDAAVAGLIYQTYTSPPWFWFALAKGVTLRDLLDFGRKKDLIPRGAITAIDTSNETSVRFANLYGFEETEEVREYQGIAYKLFWRV